MENLQTEVPSHKSRWTFLIVGLLIAAGAAAYFLGAGKLFKGFLQLSDIDFNNLKECVGLDSQDIYTNTETDISIEEGCKVDLAIEDDSYGKFLVAGIDYSLGRDPYVVNFKGITNFRGENYSWDFGDGATETDVNEVTHTYSGEGDYNVSFHVEDSKGRKFIAHDQVDLSPDEGGKKSGTDTDKKPAPKTPTDIGTTTDDGEDVDLTVSLSPDTPDGSDVPVNTADFAFATWNFTAGDEDVIVGNLTIHKYGNVTLATDHSCDLFASSGKIGNAENVNSTSNNIEFENLNWTILAKSSNPVSLKCDVGNTLAPGGKSGFEIVDDSAVDATLNDDSAATTGGKFPLKGKEFNFLATDSGTMTGGDTEVALEIVNLKGYMSPGATSTNLKAIFEYTLNREPDPTYTLEWNFGDGSSNLDYLASNRATYESAINEFTHSAQVAHTYANKGNYTYKLIIKDENGTELDQKHGQLVVGVGSDSATSYLNPFYSSVYHAALRGVTDLRDPVTAETGDAVKLITYDRSAENVVYFRFESQQWDLDILGEKEECSAADELRDILDAAAEEGDVLSEVRRYNEELITEVLRLQTDATEILTKFRELIQKFITLILTRETDIKDFVRSVTPEEYLTDVEELLGQIGQLKTLAEQFMVQVDELLSYLKRDLNIILREEVIHRFIGDPSAYSDEEITDMLENAEITETEEGSLEVVVTLPSDETKITEVKDFKDCNVSDSVFGIDDDVKDIINDVDDTLKKEKKFIIDLIDKINGDFDDFIADGNTCKLVGDLLKAAEDAVYHAFDEAKLPPLIVENYKVKPEQTIDIYDPSKHPNVKSFEVFSAPKKGSLNNEITQYKANADFSGFDAAILTLEPKEAATLGGKLFGRDMDEFMGGTGTGDNKDKEKDGGKNEKDGESEKDGGAKKTSYRATLAKAESSASTVPDPRDDSKASTDSIESALGIDLNEKDLTEIFGVGLYCFEEDKDKPKDKPKDEPKDKPEDEPEDEPDQPDGDGDTGVPRYDNEGTPDILTGDIDIADILSLERFECLDAITPVIFPDTDNRTVNTLAGVGYLEKAIVEGRLVDNIAQYVGGGFATRSEGLKMLMVASCTPYNLSFEAIFVDIGLSDWHRPFVGSARKLNLVQGYAGNFYRPNQAMTRAEAIKIMAKIIGIPEAGEDCQGNPFVDIDENHWAYGISRDAFCGGISAGKMIGGQRYLLPDERINRYEMATLIYNAFIAEYERVNN